MYFRESFINNRDVYDNQSMLSLLPLLLLF